MNQRRQTTGTYPQAFTVFAARQQNPFFLALAAIKASLRNISLGTAMQVILHRLLGELRRFPLLYRKSPLGARPNAKTGTVAKFLSYYPGLSVNNFNGALGTGAYA